jgi:hypothetical protein
MTVLPPKTSRATGIKVDGTCFSRESRCQSKAANRFRFVVEDFEDGE